MPRRPRASSRAGRAGDSRVQPAAAARAPVRASPRGEKANRFIDGELEDVVDVLAVDADVEHLGLESLAAALVAGHVDVGHEHHLDLEIAGALAGLAAAACDVEAEGAGRVPALPRQRRIGEDAPDLVERLHVRHRIRARRFADRTLVDHDDVVDRLDAGDRVDTRRRLAEVLLRAVFAVEARLERAMSTSWTSVLLPDPETPVTTVTAPNGMRTSTPFRLCSRAPVSVIHRGPMPAASCRQRNLPLRP